jgi:hypothetical protein
VSKNELEPGGFEYLGRQFDKSIFGDHAPARGYAIREEGSVRRRRVIDATVIVPRPHRAEICVLPEDFRQNALSPKGENGLRPDEMNAEYAASSRNRLRDARVPACVSQLGELGGLRMVTSPSRRQPEYGARALDQAAAPYGKLRWSERQKARRCVRVMGPRGGRMPWRVIVGVPEVQAVQPVANALTSVCATGLGDEESEEVTTRRHTCLFRRSQPVAELGEARQPGRVRLQRFWNGASSMASRTRDCIAAVAPS